MPDNEFQRPLAKSLFQLTCGRERCTGNVNCEVRLVHLGKAVMMNPPAGTGPVSLSFPQRSCLYKLMLLAPLSNTQQMSCLLGKDWHDESLENQTTSPTQCCGDPCYALEMFMLSGNKGKDSQSYSGSDFCFVLSFILLCFLESVLLQSTMNQENENREPNPRETGLCRNTGGWLSVVPPTDPPLGQAGGGS